MLQLPFDLLSWAANSDTARRANVERWRDVLRHLREGATDLTRRDGDESVSSARFKNAASDFFCLMQVAPQQPDTQFKLLEAEVELILRPVNAKYVQDGSINKLLSVVSSIETALNAAQDCKQ